jgi:hypothetical protein
LGRGASLHDEQWAGTVHWSPPDGVDTVPAPATRRKPQLAAEQSAAFSFFRETMREDSSFVFQPAIAPAVSFYRTTTRGPSPATL